MTNKISGNNGTGPIQGVTRTRKIESAKGDSPNSGTDRVSFSSVLQEAGKSREASSSQEAQRAEKINALKEQVAQGNYKPDLEMVAKSLLKSIAEEK